MSTAPTTIERTARRVPPLGGFNLRFVQLEMRRLLRNRRTVIFTLIMPAVHSASISTKLLQEMGNASVMGPMLVGLEKSVQIAPLGAKMSEIYNAAVIAAYDINR